MKSSSILHTEIKSIWTTHKVFNSIGMITLQTSDRQPAYNKPIQFLPPPRKPNQFHPNTEIKSSSIPHPEI